ncbi:MAG: hypothetical protein AMDU1_APLC00062G0020 [Thermoplasmatales archaeon A-plasma]|nr:MAG: hypothetical protein AMDU1_APLC00062G0020 [Thermoplasmatales archaeon A-plasma]WMT44061.1 MAG: NAD-dependent epimerase/dehydratase family protein [Cuniculiplasma divulgatum]
MGGTGFIGRFLVKYLLNDGHEVFAASNGKTKVSFAGEAKYLHFDRFNPLSVKESIGNLDHFDAVYDQLAFRIKDVKELTDIMAGKTDSYIFTSSAAVYSDKSGLLSEDQFDPFSYEFDDKESEKSYSDGKRNVEAYVYQNADFAVSSARFPSILGNCDSTLRFQDHLRRIEQGRPFWAPEKAGRRNFTWVDDAGRFLAWLETHDKKWPYNGASAECFDIRTFLNLIGKVMGKTVSFQSQSEQDKSGYYKDVDFILSTQKANHEGFKFTGTEEWLSKEVANYRIQPDIECSSQEYADSLFP